MARKSRAERSSGSTVLVVDDSVEYLEATRLTLEREGHRVFTCPGGSEALELLRKEHVDLVLLDYFMPGMTGEEVVQRLRQFDPHVQVMLQTGYASERPPRELLRRLDIQGYHDKSEGPEKLLLWTDIGLKGAFATQLLNKSRQGLRYILDVTPDLHRAQPLQELLQGILLQVSGLVGATDAFIAVVPPAAPKAALSPECESGSARIEGTDLVVRAGTGRFESQGRLDVSLDDEKLQRVRDSIGAGRVELAADVTIVPLQVGGRTTGVVYLDRATQREGDAELLRLLANQAAVAIQNAYLHELATVDPLTGVFGRKFLEQWTSRELRTAQRSPQPLSMVVLRLDDLGRINTEAGHAAGDQALALLGSVVRQAIRGNDIAARLSGNELAVVLPNTGPDGAATVSARILNALKGATVDGAQGAIAVEVSLGCASVAPCAFEPAEIPRPVPQPYFSAMGRALTAAAQEGAAEALRQGRLRAQYGGTVSWLPFSAETERVA
jgi:diguanylate cyclase (GGDEF)-like protein